MIYHKSMKISILYFHIPHALHLLLIVILIKIILQLFLNKVSHDYPVQGNISPRQYLFAQELFLGELIDELVGLYLGLPELRECCDLPVLLLLLLVLHCLLVHLLLLAYIGDIHRLLSCTPSQMWSLSNGLSFKIYRLILTFSVVFLL